MALERAREHQHNRLLFERVPVDLYRSTPSGKILDANEAMIRLQDILTGRLFYAPTRSSFTSTPRTDAAGNQEVPCDGFTGSSRTPASRTSYSSRSCYACWERGRGNC